LGVPYAVSSWGAFNFDSCYGPPRGFAFSGATLMAVLSFGGMNAKHVTPILNVSDISASFAWFEKWGWRECWGWGTPPTFGAVGPGEMDVRHPDGHVFRVSKGIEGGA